MSTNYYLVPKIWEDYPEWVHQIHIGKLSNESIMLQAVSAVHDIDSGISYRAPYGTLDDGQSSWQRWKSTISSDEFLVINEYDDVIDKNDFIKMIESQEDRSLAYKRHLESSTKFGFSSDSYLDSEGYSFLRCKFS